MISSDEKIIPCYFLSFNPWKKVDKNSRNLLFFRDQTQIARNILKTLHVLITGAFKLFVIIYFIIAE